MVYQVRMMFESYAQLGRICRELFLVLYFTQSELAVAKLMKGRLNKQM